MIRTYEEFKEAVLDSWPHIAAYHDGIVHMGNEFEELCRSLWNRLQYRDYVERLYLLQRGDVISVAKGEMGLDLRKMTLPENFWHDVQKVIESGLGEHWTEVVREAVRHALDREKGGEG